MLSKIIDVIIYAGTLQGFFLAWILLSSKNSNRKSNWILSLLLMILSVSIAHSVFISHSVTNPYRVNQPFILFIGPMLLFYVRFLSGGRRFAAIDIVHFLPAFLFVLILTPVWIHGFMTPYSQFLYRNDFAMGAGIWIFTILQFGFYWRQCNRIINTNKKAVESEFSNTEGKTLNWIKIFMHLFGIFFLLLFSTLYLVIHYEDYVTTDKIICVALSVTIFILGYYGFFQGTIFSIKSQTIGRQEEQSAVEKHPAASQDNESLQKILTFMEEKKPYLDENITLTELASQMDLTRNQLSALINSSTGGNFYNFINKYRVDEVKRLIAEPKNKNYTILALAYEAGFPSKSTFQNIFKKTTGLTPTEYLNNLQ